MAIIIFCEKESLTIFMISPNHPGQSTGALIAIWQWPPVITEKKVDFCGHETDLWSFTASFFVKSEQNFSVGMWWGSHWFKIKEHKNSAYYFIYSVCSKEQLRQIQLHWKAKLLRCILAPTYVVNLRTAELMKKACSVIAVPMSSWTAHLYLFKQAWTQFIKQCPGTAHSNQTSHRNWTLEVN